MEQAWLGDNARIIGSTHEAECMIWFLHKQKRCIPGAMYHSGEPNSIEVVEVGVGPSIVKCGNDKALTLVCGLYFFRCPIPGRF